MGAEAFARPPSALRREADASRVLPYARHVSDTVVALDSGALMTVFRLDGASFETADVRDLNDRHLKLNAAWRNLASDRLAVWQHLVRRERRTWPEGRFRSRFAGELDAAYRARMERQRLFANELYLTLVLRPGRDPAERTQAWVQRLIHGRTGLPTDDADLARLEETARDLAQHLGRYGPHRLGLREAKGVAFSEPMELLRLVLTGQDEPVPLVRGHLGSAIHTARVIFGREALEVRDAGKARYAGMLGVKEYPTATRPGQWDALLSAPFSFIAAQSFAFLSRPAAQAVMERKQNQLVSARDRAASQIEGLDAALDELTSNRFVMGEHQASVLVYGETARALAENMSRARSLLAESGLVAAREDLGLEAAFWAQFPGNFRHRLRPAAISSRNFAALAPFHTHPAGRPRGNHWGHSVALLRTSAGSPFHFNFHVADVGHTFICGPSGSGKTVVQNFLLAQLEKSGCRQVFIDKDRGAEIFVRACGGTYLTLRPGAPTGLAPLRALQDTPADRTFLAALVGRMATDGETPLSPGDRRGIDEAVRALLRLPASQRSMSALRSLLGQRNAAGPGARLERWTQAGDLGWALDADEDALALDATFVGFDITHLLDLPEVRTPVLMYLFHRLQKLVDGRRLVIDIDEFWKALGDEAFRGLAEDGLKTFRKQNAFMVFGTQSPADVLRSPIAHTIIEQCATKIFLPNPHASERDYLDGFGLSRRELQLVREELAPNRRRFLIKQGQDSVVAELDLDGLDDPLLETIFKKIDASTVFVGDVTPVSRIAAVRKPGQERPEKRNMNPNVAIELGYAFRAISELNVLMVLNEHYGGRKFLPFDIQGNAGHILFNLPPDADTTRIRSEAASLKAQFVTALRGFVQEAAAPAVEAFQRTPQTTSRAAFFKSGEVLATLGADSDREEYQFDTDCGVYLRMSPTTALSAPISKTALVNAMQRTRLDALSDDGWGLMATNQYGAAWVTPKQTTGSLVSGTQLFQNGEIWGFAPWMLRDRGFGKMLPMGGIERVISRALPRYLHVAAEIGLAPPYTLELGAVGIEGYVIAVDSHHPDTSLGPIYDNDVAVTVVLNDVSHAAQSVAALKLFQGFCAVSGYPRPPVVNGFPAEVSA